MKQTLLLPLVMLLTINVSKAQYFVQYFDGADTAAYNSLIIEIDSNSNNVWQIGSPQKNIFASAATAPNVIVTDTINYYPSNNTSRFMFKLDPSWFQYGIFALQWMQKLDLDNKHDGGIVEFSVDQGSTWQNVFNNPYVYNFYGFDPSNKDTLLTGEYAFSGTDTSWKDVWLCFDVSWLSITDTAWFRYTLKSDSINNNKEGWMIDNMMAHITFIHTAVAPVEQEEYLKVYPAVTSGIVNIHAKKLDGFHIIENMELATAEGKVVQRYGLSPTKFYIDISKYPDGMYFLKVKTNIMSETFPIVLHKN